VAILEINARFGGGYPLAHRAGAPFTQWLLEEATDRSSSAHDDWRPGVTMLRYDEAIFIDE
jgi:carbamoyl-phosphate synthase large subunit